MLPIVDLCVESIGLLPFNWNLINTDCWLGLGKNVHDNSNEWTDEYIIVESNVIEQSTSLVCSFFAVVVA